ncbi:MAG: glycosyltransferase family 2 protein [Lentisphaeria bacterium]|nr:glycosyltransferase family 2 protein [Lentisphaeria bacterium]
MLKNELTMAICAYKESEYLEEALQSLLRQTIPVKILLATSTPSSFLKCISDKYGVEYFVNPHPNGGIAADWEFAVSCAKTQYVTIAHQDDIYFPEYAQKVLQAFQKHPNSLIAFTDYCDLANGQYLGNRGYLWIKRFLLWPFYIKCTWKWKAVKKLILSFGNSICCPSVSYNLDKIGELKFDRNYSVNLDWAKWVELARRDGSFIYLRKRLMAHRIDESTETSAAIHDNRRYNEDLNIFVGIWGKSIANLLMKFYKKSYKMAESIK